MSAEPRSSRSWTGVMANALLMLYSCNNWILTPGTLLPEQGHTDTGALFYSISSHRLTGCTDAEACAGSINSRSTSAFGWQYTCRVCSRMAFARSNNWTGGNSIGVSCVYMTPTVSPE